MIRNCCIRKQRQPFGTASMSRQTRLCCVEDCLLLTDWDNSFNLRINQFFHIRWTKKVTIYPVIRRNSFISSESWVYIDIAQFLSNTNNDLCMGIVEIQKFSRIQWYWIVEKIAEEWQWKLWIYFSTCNNFISLFVSCS